MKGALSGIFTWVIAKKLWAAILILSFVFPLPELYAQGFTRQSTNTARKAAEEDRGYKSGVFHIEEGSGSSKRDYYIKTVVPKEAVDYLSRYELSLDLVDFANSQIVPGLKIPKGTAFKTDSVNVKAGGLCCESISDLTNPPMILNMSDLMEKPIISGIGAGQGTTNCFYMPETEYEVNIDDLYCGYKSQQAEINPVSFAKRKSPVDNKDYYCMMPVFCAKVDELSLIYEMAQPAYDHINTKKNPNQRRTLTEIMPDGAKIKYDSNTSAPYHLEGDIEGMKEKNSGNKYASIGLFNRANESAIRASLVALMSMYEVMGEVSVFNPASIVKHKPKCGEGRESGLRAHIRTYYTSDTLSEPQLDAALKYYIEEFPCPSTSLWQDLTRDTNEVQAMIAQINQYCERKAATIVGSYECVVPPRPAQGSSAYGNIGAGASAVYGCTPSEVTKQIRDNKHHTINYNTEVELANKLFATRYGRFFITDTFKDKLGVVDFQKCEGSKTIDNFEVKEHYELKGQPLLGSNIDAGTVLHGALDLRQMILEGLEELLKDRIEIYDVMNIYSNSEDWNFLDYVVNTFVFSVRSMNPVLAVKSSTENFDDTVMNNQSSKLVKYLKAYPFSMKQYVEATHDRDPAPNSREFLLTLERIQKLLYNDKVDIVKDYIIYGAAAVIAVVAICTGAGAPFGVTLATYVGSALIINNAAYNISQAKADSIVYAYGGSVGAKDLNIAYDEIKREAEKIDQNIEMLVWEGAGLGVAMLLPFLGSAKKIYQSLKFTNVAKKYNNLDDFTRVLVTGEIRAKKINNSSFLKYLDENPAKKTEFLLELGSVNPNNARIAINNANNLDEPILDLEKLFKASDDVKPASGSVKVQDVSEAGTGGGNTARNSSTAKSSNSKSKVADDIDDINSTSSKKAKQEPVSDDPQVNTSGLKVQTLSKPILSAEEKFNSIKNMSVDDYLAISQRELHGLDMQTIAELDEALRGATGRSINEIKIGDKTYMLKNINPNSQGSGPVLNEIRCADWYHYNDLGPKTYLIQDKVPRRMRFLPDKTQHRLLMEKVDGVNVKDIVLNPSDVERFFPKLKPGDRMNAIKKQIETSLGQNFETVREAYVAFARSVVNDKNLMKEIEKARELLKTSFSNTDDVQFMLQPTTSTKKGKFMFIDSGMNTMAQNYGEKSVLATREFDYIMDIFYKVSKSDPTKTMPWVDVPVIDPFDIMIIR